MKHRHISELDLLRYSDGELSWWGRFGLKRHLRSCWHCRTELAVTNQTIGAFVRYRERLWLPSVPPAPAPWPDLHAAMTQRRLERGVSRPAPWNSLRLLVAGALLAALAGAFAIFTLRWQEKTAPPASIPRVLPAPTPPLVTPPLSQPARTPAVVRPLPSSPDRNTEVRIVAALHRIGADLGEPIEIRQDGSTWQVVTTAITAGRQAELVQALRAEAGVRLVTESLPSLAHSLADSPRVPLAGPPVADHLTVRLGGKVLFEKLANQILEQSDAVMARVFALRNLDRRFPPSIEAELSAESRAILSAIRQAHRAAFAIESRRLEERATPVLDALGVSASPAASPPTDLLETARHVDEVLNSLLAGTLGRTSSADLAAELARGLAMLRAAWER